MKLTVAGVGAGNTVKIGPIVVTMDVSASIITGTGVVSFGGADYAALVLLVAVGAVVLVVFLRSSKGPAEPEGSLPNQDSDDDNDRSNL
jgi:hypothetical protein